MQGWFPGQLNGYTFTTPADPVVWYQTSHPTSWYRTNPSSPSFYAGRFWESALDDGFALTGGRFDDPNNRWLFYLDADPLPGQYSGGTSGVALMGANDLRGLNGEPLVPINPETCWPSARSTASAGRMGAVSYPTRRIQPASGLTQDQSKGRSLLTSAAMMMLEATRFASTR